MNVGDILKTIFQGALGGITFGIYHQFTSNKMMELHNKKLYIQYNSYDIQIDELKKQINKISIAKGEK